MYTFQAARPLDKFQSHLGMGCLECEGTCGLGLFDAGLNIGEWGIAEWAVIGLGAYTLASLLFTTSRSVSYVHGIPGERRKRRAAYYRKRAAELSR